VTRESDYQRSIRIIKTLQSPEQKRRDRDITWSWILGAVAGAGISGAVWHATDWDLTRWLYLCTVLLAAAGLCVLFFEPFKRKEEPR